ncbi:hypothetical protein [Sinorhizobium psoraleae]|uniref:Uncharacterized protein n=1 Tax=Sinorhizobium psoraleae TaxID=520838 RepID=A0ABT4KA54_9HYPH|nr:hypothetical protein [Sinorhizobium psoraleae]MCZ4088848.1 hypothetical protein [Sinorhizobium psoraleae]
MIADDRMLRAAAAPKSSKRIPLLRTHADVVALPHTAARGHCYQMPAFIDLAAQVSSPKHAHRRRSEKRHLVGIEEGGRNAFRTNLNAADGRLTFTSQWAAWPP